MPEDFHTWRAKHNSFRAGNRRAHRRFCNAPFVCSAGNRRPYRRFCNAPFGCFGFFASDETLMQNGHAMGASAMMTMMMTLFLPHCLVLFCPALLCVSFALLCFAFPLLCVALLCLALPCSALRCCDFLCSAFRGAHRSGTEVSQRCAAWARLTFHWVPSFS